MAGRIRRPQIIVPDVSSFPRTPGPADAAAATRAAADPFSNVYDPPAQQAVKALPALPPSGVTENAEVRTFSSPWENNGTNLTSGEVVLYATTRPWRALDVFYSSPAGTIIPTGIIVTIRVYALAASGPPTLVASGRIGNNGGLAIAAPLWAVAARAQGERFLVTWVAVPRFGAVGPTAFTGQERTITVVGSDLGLSDPPALAGAIPLDATQSFTATPRFTTGPQPELLMVQATAGPAVAAPRFLLVHENVSPAAVAGAVPRFCFPIGLGTTGGVPCTIWFPRGLRPLARNATLDMWTIGASSTADSHTAAGDCVVGGLFR